MQLRRSLLLRTGKVEFNFVDFRHDSVEKKNNVNQFEAMEMRWIADHFDAKCRKN